MRQTNCELTNDRVVLRILEQLEAEHKTCNDLTDSLGLANGTVAKWKYHGLKSYMRYLKEIAEVLEVSVDYLTKGIDDYANIDSMSASEIRLIRMYRAMDAERKETLMRNAEYSYISMGQDKPLQID